MPEPQAPSTTPRPAGSGMGCLVALIALPIVILVGIVVGSVLGEDDDAPAEQRETIDQGQIGDTTWRVDAVIDVQGDTCAFLYADDEQLTGACDPTAQDATLGDQTVVFGVAPSGADRVVVELSDGETVEVEPQTPEDVEGTFYVTVVDGDVDAVDASADPSGTDA